MHPKVHGGNLRQSLAEALVTAAGETLLHRHVRSEEIYHVTDGTGRMTLGDEQFEIRKGDTICIPQGATHKIKNTGEIPLRILCCCVPPYSHEDTEVIS